MSPGADVVEDGGAQDVGSCVLASLHSAQAVLDDVRAKAIEVIPDAVIVVNEAGVVVVFNLQAEFLFGYSRVEVLGRAMEMLVHEGQRTVHVGHRTTYQAEPRLRDMGPGLVLCGRHKSGRSLPITIKLAPMMIADAGLHVIAVVRRAVAPDAKEIHEWFLSGQRGGGDGNGPGPPARPAGDPG